MEGHQLESPTEEASAMISGPPPQIKWINASALYNRMQVNPQSLLLIDVRPVAAFAIAHVKGAINIDWARNLQRVDFDVEDEIVNLVANLELETSQAKSLFEDRANRDIILYGGEQMVQLRNLFNKSSPITPTTTMTTQPRSVNGLIGDGGDEEDDEDCVTLLTGSELAWSFAEALLHDLALNTPRAEGYHNGFCGAKPPSFPAGANGDVGALGALGGGVGGEKGVIRILEGGFDLFVDSKPFLVVNHQRFTDEDYHFPSEIIEDFLYLGDADVASKLGPLKELGVEYVINATADEPNHFPDEMKYLNVEIEDRPGADIAQHFQRVLAFLEEAQQMSSKVLVHCVLGMSRSPTIVIFYLMMTRRWSLSKCFEFVFHQRPCIWPNSSFLRQLIEQEALLFGADRVSMRIPPSESETDDECNFKYQWRDPATRVWTNVLN